MSQRLPLKMHELRLPDATPALNPASLTRPAARIIKDEIDSDEHEPTYPDTCSMSVGRCFKSTGLRQSGKRAPLLDQAPIIFDTETTGLGGYAEICEIAIINYRDEVILNTRVRPKHGIPEDASRIHGIRPADVAGAPPWAKFWTTLS